ncbi:MAG: ABC transporter permease [Acidobacteria bacterium]|nr:MAG: ABC transporter permease [Acidobacteriota bacterium]
MAIPIKYNIRNLFVRKVSTTMTLFSIALVVAVFLALMSLAAGMSATFTSSGDPSNVIVLRKSAVSETNSAVTKAEYQVVRYLAGIDNGSSGTPLVSPELIILLNIPRRGQAGSTNVMVRGVGPEAFELRPRLRLVAGRLFRPGLREMIVSRNIGGRFRDTDVGSRIKFGKGMWTVVGHFDAARQGYSAILARSADPQAQAGLVAAINADRRLQLEAVNERAFYDRQTAAAAGLKLLATIMTVFMGVGACFAAMNTMYAAVSNRTREIGTLRALGFPQSSVLLSFLIEAGLLALIGGGVGCLLALPVNGITTGTSNFNTFAEITFNFRITGGLMVAALVLSGFLGVLGGFFPARTAARQPIIESLRAQ